MPLLEPYNTVRCGGDFQMSLVREPQAFVLVMAGVWVSVNGASVTVIVFLMAGFVRLGTVKVRTPQSKFAFILSTSTFAGSMAKDRTNLDSLPAVLRSPLMRRTLSSNLTWRSFDLTPGTSMERVTSFSVSWRWWCACVGVWRNPIDEPKWGPKMSLKKGSRWKRDMLTQQEDAVMLFVLILFLKLWDKEFSEKHFFEHVCFSPGSKIKDNLRNSTIKIQRESTTYHQGSLFEGFFLKWGTKSSFKFWNRPQIRVTSHVLT